MLFRSDDCDQEESLVLNDVSQKNTWQPKTVDLMDEFRQKLYGTSLEEESKVTISLDQFDDDDEMLRRMEIEPAISRR